MQSSFSPSLLGQGLVESPVKVNRRGIARTPAARGRLATMDRLTTSSRPPRHGHASRLKMRRPKRLRRKALVGAWPWRFYCVAPRRRLPPTASRAAAWPISATRAISPIRLAVANGSRVVRPGSRAGQPDGRQLGRPARPPAAYLDLARRVQRQRGHPQALETSDNKPCLIDTQNQKRDWNIPPNIQLPNLQLPGARPPIGNLFPDFGRPTLPGPRPPGGADADPSGGVQPPIATLPPGGITYRAFPRRPPTGIMPTLPGGVQPPIATLPPGGITPGFPRPPTGIMPTLPGGVQPPIATLPPGGR